jgi:flagellar hook-length control protein FliK
MPTTISNVATAAAVTVATGGAANSYLDDEGGASSFASVLNQATSGNPVQPLAPNPQSSTDPADDSKTSGNGTVSPSAQSAQEATIAASTGQKPKLKKADASKKTAKSSAVSSSSEASGNAGDSVSLRVHTAAKPVDPTVNVTITNQAVAATSGDAQGEEESTGGRGGSGAGAGSPAQTSEDAAGVVAGGKKAQATDAGQEESPGSRDHQAAHGDGKFAATSNATAKQLSSENSASQTKADPSVATPKADQTTATTAAVSANGGPTSSANATSSTIAPGEARAPAAPSDGAAASPSALVLKKSSNPAGGGANATTTGSNHPTQAAANPVSTSTPTATTPAIATSQSAATAAANLAATSNSSAGARAVTASGGPLTLGAPATSVSAALAASDASVASTNQASIVSAIHGQLLPGGGTMQLSLNPATLGQVDITVRMNNGVMSASFQTTNDDATRLIGRSLGQLKTALEQQGVTVERLHVQQGSGSSTSPDSGNQSKSNSDSGAQSWSGRQSDQQRRQSLSRMWQRASGLDDLDMVA